jgi:hypothetical protein
MYRTLSPVLGEEEAEAMLAEFPRHSPDDLVTKDYLDMRLATMDADLRAAIDRSARQMIMWLVSTNLVIAGFVIALS